MKARDFVAMAADDNEFLNEWGQSDPEWEVMSDQIDSDASNEGSSRDSDDEGNNSDDSDQ